MTNKVIEMKVICGNSQVTFREVISECTTWMAQAYIFHKFLMAQGFVLDPEAVGAEIEDYVAAVDDVEDDDWTL
jgi:hypothetical protein